jgi:hypothetical protein
MANPSGFAELASPCPDSLEPELELELDDDPFECWPRAAALNVNTAQKTTTGLRIGPRNLSTALIANLRFGLGGEP